jgi:hypothetical protein
MEENHGEDAMQEMRVPKQINWFNTLVSTYDFATNDDWTGFDFDDEFNQHDEGQLQTQPIIFDKADLVRRLREAENLKCTKKESNGVIASTLYEFYDKCKNHFHQEFMTSSKRSFQMSIHTKNWKKNAMQAIYSTTTSSN